MTRQISWVLNMYQHAEPGQTAPAESFPTAPSGLPEATRPALLELADGEEREDDMEAVNRLTTPANMRWMLVDQTTDAANAAIDWHFTEGDRVKIRLVNKMDSDHPMHHPFRTGQTVDILFDVTNPGLWMAHCHIAEHMQSGMMFSFTVARKEAAR